MGNRSQVSQFRQLSKLAWNRREEIVIAKVSARATCAGTQAALAVKKWVFHCNTRRHDRLRLYSTEYVSSDRVCE